MSMTSGAGSPRDDPRGRPAAAPPRNGNWVAEVDWDHVDGQCRFRVMATPEEGAGAVVVAESFPLEWPPRDPAAVEALSRAADTLEADLRAAGWKPLPPGEAWYARRFAWDAAGPEAIDAAPGGAVAAGETNA